MKKIDFKTVVPAICTIARRGFSDGKGDHTQMCVEAAICAALGEQTYTADDDGYALNDRPSCVPDELIEMKIGLNDSHSWRSPADRAKHLTPIAILQLGTKSMGKGFIKRLIAEINRLLALRPIKERYANEDGGLPGNQLAILTALEGSKKLFNMALEEFNLQGVSIEHLDDLINYQSREKLIATVQLLERALINLKTPGAQWLKKHPLKGARK